MKARMRQKMGLLDADPSSYAPLSESACPRVSGATADRRCWHAKGQQRGNSAASGRACHATGASGLARRHGFDAD